MGAPLLKQGNLDGIIISTVATMLSATVLAARYPLMQSYWNRKKWTEFLVFPGSRSSVIS